MFFIVIPSRPWDIVVFSAPMSQEMDISWQVLGRIVRDWGGSSAEIAEITPLDGGCISTTVAIVLGDGRKVVCKISPHRVDRSYINEAHQLKCMRGLGVPTPEVYSAKVGTLEDPFSYILMEFVEGVNLHRARQQCSPEQFDGLQARLAEMILMLHERTAPAYGRLEIEPPASQFESWPAFYRTVFDPIYRDVMKAVSLPIKTRRHIGKIHERLDKLLQHDEVPRLVHWDVWATNILVKPDEAGEWKVAAILDPNCKFAHFEAEIAYMTLFHTSTPAFLKAYQHVRKLSDEYHRVRKLVYQLYFLLNHVVLFGGEYVKQAVMAVDRLGAVA
jgi:fructosamine-3-kinase